MDHLFSKNFEAKMLSLAKRELKKNPKTVLVYRFFEIDEDVERFPETKDDLLSLFESGKAREFHNYFNGHIIPKLDSWFFTSKNPDNDTKIQFYRP